MTKEEAERAIDMYFCAIQAIHGRMTDSVLVDHYRDMLIAMYTNDQVASPVKTKKSEWTSVKDSLPVINERVIVCHGDMIWVLFLRLDNGTYSFEDDEMYTVWRDCEDGWDDLYWFRLPEVPKGEE